MNYFAWLVFLCPFLFKNRLKFSSFKGKKTVNGKNSIQFNCIIPLNIIAGLREIVINIKDVGVALFGADVNPVTLKW